ncbi:hypothetical protein CTK_C29540 [Clostridium tyrobutyricum]|nr:hypothetical protein CTK_C29540 [Clostridium tyrobutyricum]
MNNEFVIKSYGNNSFHFTLSSNFSNSNVCNLHINPPPRCLCIYYSLKFIFFLLIFLKT